MFKQKLQRWNWSTPESIKLGCRAIDAGNLVENAHYAGDDQVGALDFCVAVCFDGGAAGVAGNAGVAHGGLDSGGDGGGALVGDGI